MTATLSLLLMLIASSTPQRCLPERAEPARLTGAETLIRQAEEEWAASIATDEAAFLERYTAPGFVAVFDGEVLPRAVLIAGARKRRPGAAAVALEAFRVHLRGSTAIAEGSELWSTFPSKRSRIIWSDLWVQCRGKWRLLTSTAAASPVSASDPPPSN